MKGHLLTGFLLCALLFDWSFAVCDDWTETSTNCIKWKNNAVYVVAPNNFNACKALCENEAGFLCCSVEMFTGTGRCQLSTFNENSVSMDDFSSPCHAKGVIYAERKVAGCRGYHQVLETSADPNAQDGRFQGEEEEYVLDSRENAEASIVMY